MSVDINVLKTSLMQYNVVLLQTIFQALQQRYRYVLNNHIFYMYIDYLNHLRLKLNNSWSILHFDCYNRELPFLSGDYEKCP